MKLEAENLLIGSNKNYLIFRPNVLFSSTHQNFFTFVYNSLIKSNKINVVNDQISNPTYVPYFIDMIFDKSGTLELIPSYNIPLDNEIIHIRASFLKLFSICLYPLLMSFFLLDTLYSPCIEKLSSIMIIDNEDPGSICIWGKYPFNIGRAIINIIDRIINVLIRSSNHCNIFIFLIESDLIDSKNLMLLKFT